MHGILRRRERQACGRMGNPYEMDCNAVFVFHISCEQSSHRLSLDKSVSKLTEGSRLVTIASICKHNSPPLRSKCEGVSDPMQMVLFQSATLQGSIQFIGELGWADSWFGVCTRWCVLVCLFYSVVSSKNLPQSCSVPCLNGHICSG